MKLILYAGHDQAGRRLTRHIQALIPNSFLEIFNTTEELIQRFRKPINDIFLSIIFAPNHSEFNEIVQFGDLLKDIRSIIIVPDNSEQTITEAYRLHPRLVRFADGDFDDIAAVVGHVMGRYVAKN